MDVEEKDTKLVQKTRKLKISALAASEESVKPAFAFQRLYYSVQSTSFPQTSGTAASTSESAAETSPTKGKRPEKAQPKTKNAVIHSDTSCDQRQVICGLANDWIAELDPQRLSTSSLSVANCSFTRKHVGLSHICCSKLSPSIFCSSSTLDGSVHQWDTRIDGQSKPVHVFSLNNSKIQSASTGSTAGVKPILTCDTNSSDQLLCGGTELVQGQEDCYLLFWDVRSAGALLGAYWESHSDDVTTVRFHPEKSHLLSSGSTDGLLNVFNLLETTEDDALLYSFNTESSVDSITWRSSVDNQQNVNHIVALTHTNDVQVWDTEAGDAISAFSREHIARAMEARDPDSVYLVGCQRVAGQNLKLVASSLSGDSTKILELGEDDKLKTKGVFSDESCVLQSVCYLQTDDRWITFDESGVVKLYQTPLKAISPPKSTHTEEQEQKSKEKRSSARFAPYNTRGADKRK